MPARCAPRQRRAQRARRQRQCAEATLQLLCAACSETRDARRTRCRWTTWRVQQSRPRHARRKGARYGDAYRRRLRRGRLQPLPLRSTRRMLALAHGPARLLLRRALPRSASRRRVAMASSAAGGAASEAPPPPPKAKKGAFSAEALYVYPAGTTPPVRTPLPMRWCSVTPGAHLARVRSPLPPRRRWSTSAPTWVRDLRQALRYNVPCGL